MNKHNERGNSQVGLIVAVLMTVLFVFALVFGLMMFVGKSDLQKNIDKKVAEGVAAESKVTPVGKP
jgi:heme/copper-type cytochrome/quinol oxidase subunit 2